MLDKGRFACIGEMAAAERIDCDYLGRIVKMTLLGPDIVEAVLDGRQPEAMNLPVLMEPFPAAWAEQQNVFDVGCTT